MSGKTIRIFVLLALLSIAGIVVTQVYWFKKAFDNTENEFNKNLHIALNETVKGVLHYNHTYSIPSDPVKQISQNYFAVMVNDKINADVLEYYLRTEFTKFNIRQSFEYRIFDCANEQMVYGGYIEGNDNKNDVKQRDLPQWKGDNYYFTIYFPHKVAGIIGGMNLWIYSSLVLLIVVLFFSYSLFVILKQKRLSEVQRDFINNMTHEIKTPVSIITVSAETLKDPAIAKDPQRLLSYSTIILDEANRLKANVERVLSITGKEDSIKQNKEKLNLHDLITSTANKINENVTHKRVSLGFSFEATNFVVFADPFHVSNMVSNLIDNAVKYSNDPVAIQINSTNPEGNKIQITFTDNGIGISKEHIKRIFDKFYRVPTGNIHNVKGFGIGLNYVQLIARSHKGTIKVLSEEGKGSSFILTLPVI
jgi:two-component system, OmpR family, phosphate regulon sensor histidine kinase PhoR